MFWFKVLAVAQILRLVNKLEPGRFGRDAILRLRGSRKTKAR